MEYIGIVAGKSGESIAKEVHKWGYKSALVAGKRGENGVAVSDAHICVDLSRKEEIFSFFQAFHVDKVIFATGHILAIELAQYLKEQGIQININPEVSLLCNNKYALKNVMKEIGLRTPDYCEIKKGTDWITQLKNIKFPVVVKSIKDIVTPQLVKSLEELIEVVRELFINEESVLLEQYIHGNDCSVVILNDGESIQVEGVLYWSKAQDDELKGFFESYSAPLELEVEKRVKEAAVNLVQHINALGLVRADIIVENDIPYILEINSVIYSNNSGSWYTISSRKDGVYSARLIVQGALRMFLGKQFDSLNKVEECLAFTDQDKKPWAGHHHQYLTEQVVVKIKEFLGAESIALSKENFEKLCSCIAYINKINPDTITNQLTGECKMLLEKAMEFLDRKI